MSIRNILIFILCFFSFQISCASNINDIKVGFQTPTYLIENDEVRNNSVFNCDTTKEECKVNFDFRNTFDEEFKSKDYLCISSFGNFELTGEEEKCNPSTIIFPIGNHNVSVKIYNKNDAYDFAELNFVVQNNGRQKEINNSGSHELKITLQGTIGENKILEGNKLTCIDTCSINFDSRESIGKFEDFIWDFGNGEAYKGNNPNHVKYEELGEYTVILKANDSNGKLHKKVFYVEFVEGEKNIPAQNSNLILLDEIQNNKNLVNLNDEKYSEIISISEVQKDFGKIGLLFIITLIFTLFYKIGKRYNFN